MNSTLACSAQLDADALKQEMVRLMTLMTDFLWLKEPFTQKGDFLASDLR